MCHAVIEVRYRNKTEPDQLIAIADAEALDKRMGDLKKNDMVERLRILRHDETHVRNVSWDVTLHD